MECSACEIRKRYSCANCGAGLKDDEKPGPDCRKCVEWKKNIRNARTMGLI